MIKNLNKVVKPEDQELTSTIAINPIMASAEIETDKLDKRTKNFQKASRSPIKTDKNGVTKPFLGAKEQPVPSDPIWPKFKLEESLFEDIEIPSSDDDLPTQMKKALDNHSIDYNEISDLENSTIYIYGLNPFTEDDLKAIYFEFSNILDSCGFEDANFTMWFTFDIVEKSPLKEDTFNLKSTKKHSIAKQINNFLNQAEVEESLSESAEDEDKCCICGEIITGYGNNANPVCDGRCCNKCNWEKVIPARLQLYSKNRNVNESRTSAEDAGPQEYVIVTADLEDKNGKQTKKNVNIIYNRDNEPYSFSTAEAADEYAKKLPEYTQYDYVGSMSRPKLSLWEEVYLELSSDDFNSNEANKHRRISREECGAGQRFKAQDDAEITFQPEYAYDENSGKMVQTNSHISRVNMFFSGNDIILEPKDSAQREFAYKVIKAYNIPSFRVKTDNKNGKDRIIIHFADDDMSI